LVYDRPGVTRDRREVEVDFFGTPYEFIDTPGLYDPGTDEVPSAIAKGMRSQALKAIADADVLCFMIDGPQGCTPYDVTLAKEIRRINKPVIILVNKSEGTRGDQGLSDAAMLGLSNIIIPLSAEHGTGMSDFSDELAIICKKLASNAERDVAEKENVSDNETEENYKNRPIQLAIMGRPNAGKSTLFNTLLGEERQLTGDIPGLTRDAIRTPFMYNGKNYTLIDTAGMRKKSRVIDEVENLATQDAKKALQYAEVVILMIDGSIPLAEHLEKQDLTLAQMILAEGRAMVLAINKWDKVKEQKAFLNHIKNELTYKLAQGSSVPLITLSALNNQNCDTLMQAVESMYTQWNRRIPTGKLNHWFDFVTQNHSPPIVRGQRIKLKYITQIKSRPPSFVVFGTKSKDIPDSYQRYLVNTLRKDFDITGVPIRLHFKSPKNPYDK
ncbi:MAG TPA: ribosome biogenesis GTPase Der, partial [Holosporales bacterium]|nr:ribosome biogenesis GTPase Der [Holosporales bacterium]